MGRDIACDSDDGNAAVLMISNLSDGSTTAWCPSCLPGFALSMAAELNPGLDVVDRDAPIGLVPVEHDAAVTYGDAGDYTARCACGWVGNTWSEEDVARSEMEQHVVLVVVGGDDDADDTPAEADQGAQ